MSWLLNDDELRMVALEYQASEKGVWNTKGAIAKAQNQHTIEKVVEWGNETCDCPTRHEEFFGDTRRKTRHNCFKCWQSLLADKETK